jgi:hypothetical protein
MINQRANLSWALAILIMSTILINIIFTFGHITVSIYRWIKGRCIKNEQNISEKYKEEGINKEKRIEDNSVNEEQRK